MGGHAVTNATRLPADHYYPIADLCLARLRALGLEKRVTLIPSVRAKASFGDIDILIEGCDWKEDADLFAKALHASTVVLDNPRSSVLSCGVSLAEMGWSADYPPEALAQVDLISVHPDHYESALAYYSWNDCGNLVGGVARHIGLKLGHEGLICIVRKGSRVIAPLALLTDWDAILPVLGYDTTRWRAGFDTLEDVFAFVTSSPFYDSEIFTLANQNHKNRVRNTKRPTYQAFLRYIAERPPVYAPVQRDKEGWLSYFCETIPGFAAQYDAAWEEDRDNTLFRARYNGRVVQEIVGLEGPALGEFMRHFRESCGPGFRRFVLTHPPEALHDEIRAFAQSRLGALLPNETSQGGPR